MGRSARSQGTANSNSIELGGARKEPEENLWTAVLSKAADDAFILPIIEKLCYQSIGSKLEGETLETSANMQDGTMSMFQKRY